MDRRLFVSVALGVAGLILYGTLGAVRAIGSTPVAVRGNLTKVVPGPKLMPVANQKVHVMCGGAHVQATTDANGLYEVSISDPGCTPTKPVSTKTAYDGSILTRQVWVSAENRATIDLRF